MNATRGAKVAADVVALLRARHALLWIVTREELRVERALASACAEARFPMRCWDCVDGITDATGAPVETQRDPSAAIDWIRRSKDRAVYVLRDLHKWQDAVVLRGLRSLARVLQTAPPAEARAVIVLTPSGDVPPELSGQATVIEWPLPDRAEVATILGDVLRALPEEVRLGAVPENGSLDAAVDAAVGLTAEEAANCYARSLVTSRRIDPALVQQEKRRVIARERVLTWYDPDPRGLDAVGGLDLLKGWLTARRAAFSQRAREFGLPAPKGVLLCGVPGCGKSLTAKAVATAWGMPLLRLDLGGLRSKFVGESEANLRRALQVAEAVAPCVLWIDEIEKALAGSTGPQGDGGVAADALGAVLSWMQERAGAVFVVATANEVRGLPPELLRKGRFDDVFWVDLPTSTERVAILQAALRQHGRDPASLDWAAEDVAPVTVGFSGAEIAALVPEALFAAFADGARELRLDDLITAAGTVVPLSKTAGEKLDELRRWAQGRARPASRRETITAGERRLDI
jgi:SpoVK/Ycf46/Vps4 family AAA+-type ATPase